MKKKLSIILLILFLLMPCVQVYANSNNQLISKFEVDGFIFHFYGKDGAVLSGVTSEISEQETLHLPSEIEGIKFIILGNSSFCNIKAKEIVLSSLVTEIRREAISACQNLEVINLPNSVKAIEFPFIKNCSNLKFIILEKGFNYNLFTNKTGILNQINRNAKKPSIVSELNNDLISRLSKSGYVDFITDEFIKYQDIHIFMSECGNILKPDGIRISIDGKIIESTVQPIIISGRTMVPLRAIFEELGAHVSWDNTIKLAKIHMGDTQVEVSPNTNEMLVNGKSILLDVPPQIVNSSTLVPVRAISEALKCKVVWDDELQIVAISTSSNSNSIYNVDDAKKIYDSNIFKIYPLDFDHLEYINNLTEKGYYILGYNSYGDTILKNKNQYISVALSSLGTYVLNFETSDMDMQRAELNMMLIHPSSLASGSGGGNYSSSANTSSNSSNTANNSGSNSGVNMSDIAIEYEIAQIKAKIQKLQNELNAILSEKNVRVYSEGGWIYTHNEQAAALVREQIEDLQLKLSIYEKH